MSSPRSGGKPFVIGHYKGLSPASRAYVINSDKGVSSYLQFVGGSRKSSPAEASDKLKFAGHFPATFPLTFQVVIEPQILFCGAKAHGSSINHTSPPVS